MILLFVSSDRHEQQITIHATVVSSKHRAPLTARSRWPFVGNGAGFVFYNIRAEKLTVFQPFRSPVLL